MSASPRHPSRPAALRLGTAGLLALCALLGACATGTPASAPAPAAPPVAATPEPPPPPPLRPVEADPQAPATQMQPPAQGALGTVLAHADRVRSLPAAELTAEIARLNEANQAAGNADPTLQMQQALALAQTRSAPDLARALALLQRVGNDNSPSGRALQPLARLLAARYGEQRKVEEERDRHAQQARDAQRRIDQLNDRLEALRAIERSFGRPATVTPPGGASGNGAAPRPSQP